MFISVSRFCCFASVPGIFANPVSGIRSYKPQSPLSLISLGLATSAHTTMELCMDPTPHRSPTASDGTFRTWEACPLLFSSKPLPPLSCPSRTLSTVSSMIAAVSSSWCLLLCCNPSQSQESTKPGPWLEMAGGKVGKNKGRIKTK